MKTLSNVTEQKEECQVLCVEVIFDALSEVEPIEVGDSQTGGALEMRNLSPSKKIRKSPLVRPFDLW